MATISELYERDDPVSARDIDVPPWIESGITCADVASICEGGCASGAYMPAVTYWQANETMAKHGDDVLQFIDDTMGELPDVPKNSSWSGIAVFFLSVAVELWASNVAESIDFAEDED
jgi:hypothetical protein